MLIRPARLDDCPTLCRIAKEAKAHWGYHAEDLHRWQAELTVTADSLRRHPTFVADSETGVVGFLQLSFAPEAPELEHMWVLPERMGRGIGRALLERGLEEVASRGHARLIIDADPNAERFYRSCGAERTGDKAAPAVGQPNRVRPQLVLPVAAFRSRRASK